MTGSERLRVHRASRAEALPLAGGAAVVVLPGCLPVGSGNGADVRR